MTTKDFLVYFFHRPLLVTLFSVQVVPYLILFWSALVAGYGLLQKKKVMSKIVKYNKFAVIISAHNEEKSLPALLRGVNAEKYPKGCFHIFVLADHCTDRTVEVAKAFNNVTVLERNLSTQKKGKGALLSWGLKKIIEEKLFSFDAFMFFDADNVPKEDFMERMNESLNSGNEIIQGNRRAAGSFKSPITSWYAIYWVLYNYLFEYSREKLGFSPLVTGTGFVVRKDIIANEGWNTSTITEDVEFTIQQCLKGRRASFNLSAIFYDEQPSNFGVMLNQLSRWCTGAYQILPKYFKTWAEVFHEKPSKRLIDVLSLLTLGPANSIIFVCSIWINLIMLKNFPLTLIFWLVTLLLQVIATWGISAYALKQANISMKKISSGFLTFPLFMLMYSICSLVSLFFPQKNWKKIEHKGISVECVSQKESLTQLGKLPASGCLPQAESKMTA